jgi:FSR family fosmidomycin resistance protein-like MFS transporter
MAIGWGATLILFWRLHRLPARSEPPSGIRRLIPRLIRVFLPLIGIHLVRNFLAAGLAIYLPTFMRLKGHDLVFAGTSLAVWEFAGVGGSLASGTLSDRLGRKPILLAAIICSSFLALIFLNIQGVLILPLLTLLGFTTLAPGPVMLAIVQENFPKNRAAANGLYLSIAFILRPLTIMATGFLGDHLGLQSAFTFGAMIALLAIPLILLLPNPD